MQVRINFNNGNARTEEWNRVDVEKNIDPAARQRFYNGEKLAAHGPATVITYQLAD